MDLVIPLGPGHTLSKDDLSRALFCAKAVYMKNGEAENFLRKTKSEYPTVMTFHKVHMARGDGVQKFLVAYNDDQQDDGSSSTTVFVAFKGTESLQDVACDLSIDEERRFGLAGSFHRGFFERASGLLGTNHNPFHHLIMEPGKRVIFCGHSLGGAVAHMLLLQFFLLKSELSFASTLYPNNSMFSVAFGAPHVCDEKAAGNINSNVHLKWRFINIIYQSDPVPRALHHLKSTLISGLRSQLSEADKTLKSIGGFLGPFIEGYARAGLRGARVAAVKAAAAGARGYLTQGIVAKLHKISSATSPDSSEPDFSAIGLYIFLTVSSVHGVDNWSADQVHGDSPTEMTGFLEGVDFAPEKLGHHQLQCYRDALVAASVLDKPIAVGCNATMPHEAPGLLVSTPAPKVTSAEWRKLDVDQQYIIINGENLLFLSEAVKINGLEPWTTTKQSDNQLVICDPSEPGLRTHDSPSRLENAAMSVVVIKTAFGDTHHIIVEDSRNRRRDASRIGRMISKIIQTLVVKSTPPLSVLPSDDVLGRLEKIMKCVPGLERKMSKNLRNLTKCNDNHYDVAKLIKEINDMVEKVITFLRSSLKVDTLEMKEQADRKFTFTLTAAVLGVIGVVATPSTPLVLAVGCIGVGTTIGGIMIYRSSGVIIEEYLDVLKLAIEETSHWCTPENQRHDQMESSEQAFESKLLQQVEGACPLFTEMIEGGSSDDLRSKTFRAATRESRLRFLTRIKVVVDTLSLWNTEVTGKRFLGIFGAEDSGKSTFVKKVLEAHGPRDSELPDTGIWTHTTIVRPYLVNTSMWLVDFPGSNGIGVYADGWKQFTALSSSAVLLLNFQFDIKRDQVKMYQELKESLQTEVVVVFNKVDEKYTPRDQATFTAEFFEKLRMKNAQALDCSKDDVYFASFDPDTPDKLADLKMLGVLGHEELVQELIVRKALVLP